MNKISIILASILSIFFVAGCDNSFLDENPTAFVNPEALLTNKTGAEKYLVGTYDAIRVIATGHRGWASAWGTFATDEIVMPAWGADPKEIYLHSLSASNSTIRSIWENFYISINRVNSAVDRIGAMTENQINSESKNIMVAEARYLRAMLYFSVVTTWENVPLVKNETTSLNNLEVPQATPQEVYDFIIADLQFAKSVLSAKQGKGRATKGAAQALLGKVYLQMTGFPLNDTSKFALAEVELKEVIDSGVYDLLNFYPDVFTLNNEQSAEMVFAIGNDGPGINQGGNLGTFYGPLGNSENGGQAGNNWYVNHELAGDTKPAPLGTTNWNGVYGPRNNYAFAQGYDNDDIRCRNNIAKHDVNKKTLATGAEWTPNTTYAINTNVFYGNNVYRTSVAGTSGTTPPTHNLTLFAVNRELAFNQKIITTADRIYTVSKLGSSGTAAPTHVSGTATATGGTAEYTYAGTGSINAAGGTAKFNYQYPITSGNWTPEDGMYNPLARNELIAVWKPWKWHNVRPSNWANDTPYDDPYIRYADVLLLYAEALNGQDKLTQAIIDQTVNRLRARARRYPKSSFNPDGVTMSNTIAPDMTLSSNKSINADEILSERRKELCFEGWRRNDLIRFGKYKDATNVTQPVWSNTGNPKTQYSDFEIRWPIPDSEIRINSKLVQNTGY
jgi:hypothetical protein